MDIGLEEVVFDNVEDNWEITIGFSRPWDRRDPHPLNVLDPPPPRRVYKVVCVDDSDGKVLSLRIRD